MVDAREEQAVDGEPAIPPQLRLVRDFVNTYERQVDNESLTSPKRLSAWFMDRGLLRAGEELGPSDLHTARTLREALRGVLLSHAGHGIDSDAESLLNDLLGDIPVRVAFSGGEFRLAAAGPTPMDRAVAQVLEAIHRAESDGTWLRLKVCDRETCRWAYYDASRNQSRRWCSMAGCGNHIKMHRAYAARRLRQQGSSRPHGQ